MKHDIRHRQTDTAPGDQRVPADVDLSQDIYFRHLDIAPTEWEAHAHPWGQLNYLTHGVMNLTIAGKTFLSPPQYAIWIPPGIEHTAVNTTSATYRAVYLSAARSAHLPAEPCAMTVSPLLRAILDEFSRLGVRVPASAQQKRMARVALDQIEASARVQAYMPMPSSALLKQVLACIEGELGVRHSTKSLANRFHLTVRTLERRCMAEIGIAIGEWQQRLRFVHALQALDAGRSVKQVALELGYASPSVFIDMFRRAAGQTPDQYRRSRQSEGNGLDPAARAGA